MRFLLITAIYPPDIGGPASYVPKVADALAAGGHYVTVLTMSDGGGVEKTSFGELVRVDRRRSVFLRKLAAGKAVFRLARRADVIYVNGLFEEVWPMLLLRRRRVVAKVVGDWAWERMRLRGAYQGSIDQFQTERHLGVKGAFLRFLRWLVVQPYRHIVVPGNYLAGIVVKWFGSKEPNIHVIYNGVTVPGDVNSSASHNRHNSIRICTVCRLVPWKRVDELITCLEGMERVRLTVVGDGPERGRLEMLAVDCSVSEKVEFLGSVTRTRVLQELELSDIVVLNSDYEGMPHVLIEAMALGKPIIARRSGGSAELVRHGVTGFLVSKKEELRDCIIRLAGDAEERLRAGAMARLLYEERYLESKMLEQTVSLLSRIGTGSI